MKTTSSRLTWLRGSEASSHPSPKPGGSRFFSGGSWVTLGLFALATSVAMASPTSFLSASSTNIITGQSITLTSTINDPEGNLSNQAVDISTDGSNWTSGWDSWDGTTAWYISGSSATGTIDYAPPSAGVYYFRSRGVNTNGVLSDFVYVTVTVSDTAPNNPPSSSLSTSSEQITVGQSITLTSTITDPDGNLTNQAVDISTDNSNWTSGWDSWSGTTAWWISGNSATNTVNYTPPSTGTYYFRSRGVDSAGVLSDFVYVTVTVHDSNSAPSPGISIDGYNPDTNITRPSGSSVQVTVRYTATDPDGNLQGIRYNVWNATTGYFDNGTGGFTVTAGDSGEVDRTVALNSDGDWYFWTDAQDTAGGYSSTGAWQSGFHLHVTQAANYGYINIVPTISLGRDAQGNAVAAYSINDNGTVSGQTLYRNNINGNPAYVVTHSATAPGYVAWTVHESLFSGVDTAYDHTIVTSYIAIYIRQTRS